MHVDDLHYELPEALIAQTPCPNRDQSRLLVINRADGSITELGAGALPLGIRLELELPLHEAVIDSGDTLLLYTDGVVETLNAAGESFGFERLREGLVAGGSSRVVHGRVLTELDRFRGEEPVYDDRSLVVVSRESR